MKKLQNNFTTPEQSKRLLELGLSAYSADETYKRYYEKDSCDNVWVRIAEIFSGNVSDFRLPCWSVGRLIEIIGICAGMECVDFETLAWTKGIWSEKLICLTEDLAKYDKLDFSKLED